MRSARAPAPPLHPPGVDARPESLRRVHAMSCEVCSRRGSRRRTKHNTSNAGDDGKRTHTDIKWQRLPSALSIAAHRDTAHEIHSGEQNQHTTRATTTARSTATNTRENGDTLTRTANVVALDNATQNARMVDRLDHATVGAMRGHMRRVHGHEPLSTALASGSR